MSRRLSLKQLLLVSIAFAAIVGHICVLPGHVHAAPAASGHASEEPAHNHAPADGTHAASCEALRPASSPSVPTFVVGMLPTATSFAMAAVGTVERSSDRPPPRSSPPLYLTHRSLLI
jgi:hypothetical protein